MYEKAHGLTRIPSNTFPYELLIIDTGVRKKSTGHAIEHVKAQTELNGMEDILAIG